MARPSHLELTDDTGADFEEECEIAVGRSKKLRVKFTPVDHRNRTGVIITHFVKVDGVPVVTILANNDKVAGAEVTEEVAVRAVRGTEQSVRVIVWDKLAAGGVSEIATRRVRFSGC